MSTMELAMDVLLFKEGDQWVAQCLQHDIVGQGETIDDALFGLEACVIAHWTIDLEHNQQPFAWIPRAPQSCWDRWHRAKGLKEPGWPQLFDDIPEDLLKHAPPPEVISKLKNCEVRVF